MNLKVSGYIEPSTAKPEMWKKHKLELFWFLAMK